MRLKGRNRKKPESQAKAGNSQALVNQLASLSVGPTAGGHSPALAAAPAAAPDAASLKPTLPTTGALPRYYELERLQSLREVKADNMWDLLPNKLQADIINLAGPFTSFVCGYAFLTLMDDAEKRALWADVIKHDWQGKLSQLPDVQLMPAEIAHVKTRRMFERLVYRFPLVYEQPWLEIIPMQNMWLDMIPKDLHIELVVKAIKANCAGFIKWLFANNFITIYHFAAARIDVLEIAAQHGALEMVQYIATRKDIKFRPATMDAAAGSGNLDLVKWLHAKRKEGCTKRAMALAAFNGHLHVIKWLHANRKEGCTTKAMDAAAYSGHLYVIQWLHANRTEGCTTDAIDNAAAQGHWEVVQWLAKNRTEGFTHMAYRSAMFSFKKDVLQCLEDSMTPAQRIALSQKMRNTPPPMFHELMGGGFRI